MDNYYQLLNINNNASFENINLAYENAISKYNNLTFLLPQQITEIKKLKTALYVLTNPELKNKYDNQMFNIKPHNIDNEDDFDSVFKIDQKVDVKATNQAVANITQDSSAMAKLANTINSSVMDKIQNDSVLQQAMQAASNLQKSSSTAGGLADMLSSVTKMMESVLTPGTVSNTQSNTIIKNKMKTSISNTTINENKIKSIVENNINNTIKQLNSASCNINTSASNQLTAGNVDIADGGQAIITQVANVNALNTCILGAAQVAKMVTDITSNNENATSTDTSNKNTAGQTMAATATVQETTETKAALESAISSFSPFAAGSSGIIICIIILLIIGVGAYLYSTMS